MNPALNAKTNQRVAAIESVLRAQGDFLERQFYCPPDLYARSKQLRQELLSYHLAAVMAVAQLAEAVEGSGPKASARETYAGAVEGYRRVESLLSSSPFLPGQLETLEQLRFALALPLDKPLGAAENPLAAKLAGASPPGKSLGKLTSREVQVLKLIAEGKSTKQLAYILGITFKTAVSHRSNLMEKLNLHDVSSLVRFAIRQRLVEA